MNSPSSCESGFTLVEVIVALAIFSISFAFVLSAMKEGLEAANANQQDTMALAVAQSVLSGAGHETPLRARDTDGETTNGIHWHLHVEPYGSGADRMAWPVDAFLVTASASWHGRQSVKLSALRFAAKDLP